MRGPARSTLAVRTIHEPGRLTVWETNTDAYWLAHATLTVPALDDRVDVRVAVKNLFDAEYALPGGWEHDQVALPRRGRRLDISLGFTF